MKNLREVSFLLFVKIGLIIWKYLKIEKSYFNDFDDQESNSKINQIYKAFTRCIEDYQSEVKHSKIIIKELQNCWENKEKDLHHKEQNLNEDFTKKYEKFL